MAAHSGTGKSTTTAALMPYGWTYLSDEAVALDAGSTVLQGIPKPISLTPDGIDLLRASSIQPENDWPVISNRAVVPKVLCAASSVGGEVASSISCGVVALLERDDSSSPDPVAEPISAAEATVRLLSLTQDFERFGAHGLETLASICAVSSCVELHLGAIDRTERLLRQLTERPQPSAEPPIDVVEFEGTRTVFVESEAVVMNTGTLTAVSLPATTAEHWSDELDGRINRYGVASKLTELAILPMLEAVPTVSGES